VTLAIQWPVTEVVSASEADQRWLDGLMGSIFGALQDCGAPVTCAPMQSVRVILECGHSLLGAYTGDVMPKVGDLLGCQSCSEIVAKMAQGAAGGVH